MNAAVSILVSLVLVAGGIGTYHVVTSSASEDGANPEISLASRDLQDMEERLSALEGRAPVLQGNTSAQDLYDRLRIFEERLDALEKRGPKPSMSAGVAGPVEAPPAVRDAAGNEVVELADGETSPLTAAQEKRVRDLMNESMRSRFQRGGRDRTARTLERLGIELTDDQRKKLDDTMSQHMTKVRDLFRSGRESGQSREELRSQMQQMNQELTQQVSEFIPAADAEAIVTGLTSFGGGPGGSRGGRR